MAAWYDEVVEDKESYQQQVILPHLTRILALTKNDHLLDVACGTGFFAHSFAKQGANVTGVDVAPELVALAKRHAGPREQFVVGRADQLPLSDQSATKATCILALQNIQNLEGTLFECQRALAASGTLHLVLNHPAFRVPRGSSWGFDNKEGRQYRRIDHYLTESRVEINMHPGGRATETTLSFHRPLQVYMKALRKCGFAVTALEEWISHKKSEPGPHAKTENNARKEIPLFLYLEAGKLS